MVPARTRISTSRSKSAQSPSSGGRLAEGIDSKIFVRVDARPVSMPDQYGLEADSATKCGSRPVIAFVTAIAWSPEPTPTW